MIKILKFTLKVAVLLFAAVSTWVIAMNMIEWRARKKEAFNET